MVFSDRVLAWLGRHPSQPKSHPQLAPPDRATPSLEKAEPNLFELAADLEHGAPCPSAVLEGLSDLMRLRRAAADVVAGPTSPLLSALRVVRAELPPWWADGDNLLLAGDGAQPPEIRVNPYLGPPRRTVLVIGKDARFNHVNLGLEGALIVIGDGTIAPAGALSCYGRSTVLMGEQTTCTNWAMLDCRNGGIIVSGADGMWAHGVSVLTDDTHAIRDASTGQRLNTFGGRIVIDRHVWLCEQARLLDGAYIGNDAVIGAGALVKSCVVAPNTVAVGIPARPVRSGITWSREDAP